nr:unnamed protein product [Digitaria exilis]
MLLALVRLWAGVALCTNGGAQLAMMAHPLDASRTAQGDTPSNVSLQTFSAESLIYLNPRQFFWEFHDPKERRLFLRDPLNYALLTARLVFHFLRLLRRATRFLPALVPRHRFQPCHLPEEPHVGDQSKPRFSFCRRGRRQRFGSITSRPTPVPDLRL